MKHKMSKDVLEAVESVFKKLNKLTTEEFHDLMDKHSRETP